MLSRRRIQWSWALYGWANHGYATTVIAAFFPIFLDKYWAKGLPGTVSTGYLALANGSAGAVVMVLAPWLGAVADRRGWKKRLLAIFTAVGALGSAALALVGENGWVPALLLYGLSSVGFYAGYSLLDSMLVDVAGPREYDRVSSFGFAIGYLGGALIFVLNVLMVLHPQAFGLDGAASATRLAFVVVAVWWVLFALPLFRGVPANPPNAAAAGWREIWGTAKTIAREPTLRSFLLGYWIYIDALGTLQQMAADFGTKLGFSSDALIKALLMVQFISFPAALAFGRIGEAIGTRRGIYLGLAGLIVVSGWSYFMQTETQFYELAALVGLVQGGVQSLSRAYFSRLIPPGKSGEYFGFYNFVGKFAAVIGPLVIGAVVVLSGNQRLSIFPLIFSFLLGAWLLSRVRETPESVRP